MVFHMVAISRGVRHYSPRIRGVLWAFLAASIASLSTVAAERPSLIEHVYILDSTGTECVSCPAGEIPEQVQEIVAEAEMPSYVAWLKRSFDLNDDWWNSRFKRGDPEHIFMDFQMDTQGGVRFQTDGLRIRYEESECWFFDCYKPRMWRLDSNGTLRWKRKVPFADAPVEPFVVGDFILYVGRTSRGMELVILDAATGRVVETFAPEGEPYGFYDSALMFAPSFYREGHVYLKGQTEGVLDLETKGTVEEAPAKTYVLKVRF